MKCKLRASQAAWSHSRPGPAIRRKVLTTNRSPLERFRAKWIPVRVKKTRQNKKLEPGSDSIRTGKALAPQKALAAESARYDAIDGSSICLTGKSLKTVSSLLPKNIRLVLDAKSLALLRPSCPAGGAYARSPRTLGQDAMDVWMS